MNFGLDVFGSGSFWAKDHRFAGNSTQTPILTTTYLNNYIVEFDKKICQTGKTSKTYTVSTVDLWQKPRGFCYTHSNILIW